MNKLLLQTQTTAVLPILAKLAPSYSSRYAAKLSKEEITNEDRFYSTFAPLPRKIDYHKTATLFSRVVDPIILGYAELLKEQGWQFYAVDQRRGTCYYIERRIAIPLWAIQRNTEYLEWYIAHEIAHAFAGHKAKHGEYFMAWLEVICPAYSLHYETDYKPRNATMHGISSNMETNILKNMLASIPDEEFL